MSKRINIGQAELNYIFARNDSTERVGWDPIEKRQIIVSEPIKIRVPDGIIPLMKKFPFLGVTACWRHVYGHSGLSSFVLHYLTKREDSIEEFHQKLRKWTEDPKQAKTRFSYFYCYDTELPIVRMHTEESWRALNRIEFYEDAYYRARRRLRSLAEQELYNLSIKKLDGAFENHLAEYKEALEEYKDDPSGLDAFMRGFGGCPIKKEIWQHLTGVANIFL